MNTPDTERIRHKIAHWCAAQEHCRKEVREKLEKVLPDDSGIDVIIELLEKEGFVNEERFARHFAESKFRHFHWGKLKIEAALLEKGIPEQLIRNSLHEIDEKEYLITLGKLITENMKGKSYDQMMRFFANKGYEPELLEELLSSYGMTNNL